VALPVQRVELGEDDLLGRGIEDERAVAPLAGGAGLGHALGRRLGAVEEVGDLRGRAFARPVPVRCQDLISLVHPRHILAACPPQPLRSPRSRCER